MLLIDKITNKPYFTENTGNDSILRENGIILRSF